MCVGVDLSGTKEDAEDGPEHRSLSGTRQDHRGGDRRVFSKMGRQWPEK